MKIENLEPGMIVYDVHSTKMGNTSLKSMGVWNVKIVSIDLERQSVECSWNGNPPRSVYRKTWSKWRKEKPLLITSGMGRQRLATREEIKAHKEKGNV